MAKSEELIILGLLVRVQSGVLKIYGEINS